MTTSSLRVADRMRVLERADYEAAAGFSLPERQIPEPITFFRITDLARFWDDPQSGRESLAERQQALITSLYGSRTPWVYLITGLGGSAAVFVGAPCRESEARQWEQFLAAQLPGSSWRMDRPPHQIMSGVTGFPYVASLSGNPSVAVTNNRQPAPGHRSSGLATLLETMAGCRWSYIVVSKPLTDQELTDSLHGLEGELAETKSSFLRRGSAEENNNPLVARYVSLLESAHRKFLLGQKEGMWDVQSYLLTDREVDCQRGARALHAAFGGPASEPQPIRIKIGSRAQMTAGGATMTTRLNTAEVAMWAGLPGREVAGLQVSDYVAFGLSCEENAKDSLALGVIMSGGTTTPRWYSVSKDSLSKHVFIAGVPGAGKTRTCFYLLSQLWREHGIPWLVVEPSMKSEYRALLQSSIGPDLQVWTAGDESVAPLRMNPLEVLSGVHVQTHIGGLATIFKAAFAMDAPLPYVLDEAIYRVYEERGWDFVSGKHPNGGADCQPTLGDLLDTSARVIHDLGYDNQLKGNIQAALKTRLTSLMRGAKGLMLNVRLSTPMESLLAVPTVVEFSAIGDEDEKAFLVGCILLKLTQYRQTAGLTTRGLQHLTLIEEAHRLLRNVPETVGSSVANPRRQAVEAFSNMLAELRAYGEGLMVVDQTPSKLVPDVIKNSGLKIVHRLTSEEERTLVGGSMSLNEAQTRFLSSLPAGQVIVCSGGSANACRVGIPDHAGREGYLREFPSNAAVKAHMQKHLEEVQHPLDSAATRIPTTVESPPVAESFPPHLRQFQRAVVAYTNQRAGKLEAEFLAAAIHGFDALWQFGSRIALNILPRPVLGADAAFVVVMAIAGQVGMGGGDILVLRRNMTRLWTKQTRGGQP